jgi:putative membrane protein
MTTLLAATCVVEHGWGRGPGPWIGAFWFLALVALFLVLGRRRFRGRPWTARNGEAVLAERYARGDITDDEYRTRLATLREGDR